MNYKPHPLTQLTVFNNKEEFLALILPDQVDELKYKLQFGMHFVFGWASNVPLHKYVSWGDGLFMPEITSPILDTVLRSGKLTYDDVYMNGKYFYFFHARPVEEKDA